MRLDDLRVIVGDWHPGGPVPTRPVSRAEVLQAALTEPCPDCLNGVEAIPNGIGDPIATGSCRTCDGRGWLLIDGVRISPWGDGDTLFIPVSMLEGDDT